MTKRIAAVSGDTSAGILSERMRVSAIIESPEGKRNPELATELALRTVLDAESAKNILAKTPPANPYLAAMSHQGPVGIGAATTDFSTPDPKETRIKEIAASMAAFNLEQRTRG